MKKEVDEILESGVIRCLFSSWSSPMVLVRKNTGKWRFCIDFRRLKKKDAYALLRMSFILVQLMDQVITLELAPKVLSYLDDIVITSASFEEHLLTLEDVFHRLKAKLIPNFEKCGFARTQLKYLDHVLDEDCLHPDPDKVAAILEL